MAEFPDTLTLAAARSLLRPLVREGHKCPLCTQFAKVYARTIHSTMARELIALYRASGDQWAYLTDVLPRGGDLVKCRYWRLLEEDKAVRPDGSTRSGWWRLTPLGMAFVSATASVPKHALIYDGRCLGHEGPPVSIVDCLGKRFNYAELMAA